MTATRTRARESTLTRERTRRLLTMLNNQRVQNTGGVSRMEGTVFRRASALGHGGAVFRRAYGLVDGGMSVYESTRAC